METAKLKRFSLFARRTLIEQVGTKLDVVLADGSAARREQATAVKDLEEQLQTLGREQLIERVAYTWFNRFCALRYMDVNRYTRIGIVSPEIGKFQPEILAEAKMGHIDAELVSESTRQRVTDLLDGTFPSRDPQTEAYRLLLVAACNHYHSVMPFLFESIADWTELLMPDDLLSGESILAYTREALLPINCSPEHTEENVEVIGWLYQFYISEKKDEVFAALKKGKKITAENIPAATQLFTPHWIVRYLVENSLGRLWMLNHPESKLVDRMDYYIRPEEPETDFLRIASPEEIKVCDPACGSGHMLTYAFDLLYAIYEEQGYPASDIPRLILENNLYGIEIDHRAGALAAFALTMKAREKYRRFLTKDKVVQPNICVLENIRIEPEEFHEYLAGPNGSAGASLRENLANMVDACFSGQSQVTGACPTAEQILRLCSYREQALQLADAMLSTGQLLSFPNRQRLRLNRSARETLFAYLRTGRPLSELDSPTLVQTFLRLFREAVHSRTVLPHRETVDLESLIHQFYWRFFNQYEDAGHLGSLIQPFLTKSGALLALIDKQDSREELFVAEVHKRLLNVLRQALYLSPRYHVVVANPPYMGSVGMNPRMKKFAAKHFKKSKPDLFAMFIERNLDLVVHQGATAMITMQSWMFLSTFEDFRTELLKQHSIRSMAHLGPRAFDTISGEVVSTTAFILSGSRRDEQGCYIRLVDGENEQEKRTKLLEDSTIRFHLHQSTFDAIPGHPIAYWVSSAFQQSFAVGRPLGELAVPTKGMFTGNDEHFVRYFWEPSIDRVLLNCASHEESEKADQKWYPYIKGGEFRRWYGNLGHVVNFQFDGRELRESSSYGERNPEYYFQEAITWTDITSSDSLAVRHVPQGCIASSVGNCIFDKEVRLTYLLGVLSSRVIAKQVHTINSTWHCNPGDIKKVAVALDNGIFDRVCERSTQAVEIAKSDWDSSETSWDFQTSAILDFAGDSLRECWVSVASHWNQQVQRLSELETENNQDFLALYCLADEMTPAVSSDQVTLNWNSANRYGSDKSESELEALLLADTMREFVSYAVGCMFGRYSLDKPGLVMANQGETAEDYRRQIPEPTFAPDEDNVIPLLDGDWFPDDISERFKAFLKITFGTEHYEENLTFLENGLYPQNLQGKRRKTIRDYFLKEFYNHHVRMYKKRPIYWLFSSPKGTFNALIYMHRYRPDTVSIVLNDYLREFHAKLTAKAQHLQTVANSAAASSTDKAKALKEIAKLKKGLKELEDYEHKILYPLAARQLEIDLDDGVKVNYNKFGKALKKVTGLTK